MCYVLCLMCYVLCYVAHKQCSVSYSSSSSSSSLRIHNYSVSSPFLEQRQIQRGDRLYGATQPAQYWPYRPHTLLDANKHYQPTKPNQPHILSSSKRSSSSCQNPILTIWHFARCDDSSVMCCLYIWEQHRDACWFVHLMFSFITISLTWIYVYDLPEMQPTSRLILLVFDCGVVGS